MKYAKSIFLAFLIWTASVAAIGQCIPVTHANDDLYALNGFWHTNIPMCQIQPGSNNAYADRQRGVVLVDQSWLDQMAYRYGNWAASGILAHEWGHMVQGPVSGTAAELQADCLAGVFLKGVGRPWSDVNQFATSNFFAGDLMVNFTGHGTGPQRVVAARRGYLGYVGQTGPALAALCPYSAF